MLSDAQAEFLRSIMARARARIGTQKRKPTIFAPFDEQRSGAGPDERDPAALNNALGKFVIDKGWDLQIASGRLRGRWADLVGREISEHVVIETFSLDHSGQAGVLVLRADSTAWATQMRLLLPMYEDRLHDEIGHGRLAEIKVLAPSAPSWKHGPRSVAGRGPRDTYG